VNESPSSRGLWGGHALRRPTLEAPCRETRTQPAPSPEPQAPTGTHRHADTARTFLVGGHASKQAERLVAANREALDLAIAACAPGVSLGHLAAGAFLPLPAT
jgi:hypothetical protein